MTAYNNIRLWLILLSLAATLTATAAWAQGAILEAYVQDGLRSNLALNEQRLTLEQSLETLREARGLFLPSVDASIQANGLSGQTLNIGDLLNPVYASLNQMMGAKAFPTDLNIQLPPQRQTTLQATLPIFSPEIYYNYRIRSSQAASQKSALQVFERTLVADIKNAYFNYAKTVRLVELYNQTQSLLEENLRVSERLVENDKATTEIVFRAHAELSDLEQKQSDAARLRNAAQRYFNFLLNRELDSPIKLDDLPAEDPDSAIKSAPNKDETQTVEYREELSQLRHGIEAATRGVGLYTSAYLPSLFLGMTYGFQGTKFDYGTDKDYTVVSLQARWNLFDGFRTTAKRQGAILERRKLTAQLAELRQQVSLQARTTYDDLTVARAAIQSSRDRLASAKRTFEIVTRKYELGAAPQIEYVDARTTYTNAASNAIVTLYEYYARAANYERVTAAYPLQITHD